MDNYSAFALSLDELQKMVNKIKSAKISEFGIRPAHFNCLMHIDLSTDGLTPTELSRDCGVDKGFVSRTTADLIKGGFIKTNDKFNDGRKYKNKYILTEKGKEVIKEIRTIIDNFFADISEKISEYDLKCFWRVIIAICDNIKNKTVED